MYFNPRSREGSDMSLDEFTVMLDISIRAPAKGATGFPLLQYLLTYISIRAPAKGATTLILIMELRKKYFNPRSREGSDMGLWGLNDMVLAFQSALPRRERQNEIQHTIHAKEFQSALPRRERQQYYTTIFIFLYNTVYFVSNNIK